MEESPIVQDTRKIRSTISTQFNDNVDQYIDYLQSQDSNPSKKKTQIVSQEK